MKEYRGTHGESTRNGIEAHMNLMHKVCRVAHAHEGAAGVHIILPAVKFFVILQREMVAFLFGFEEQTVRFHVYPFDVGNIT